MVSVRPISIAFVAALAVLGCSDAHTDGGFGPTEPQIAAGDMAATTTGAVLVECPASSVRSASGKIGAAGGRLRLDAHELALPLAAVTAPTPFRLEASVSNYMVLTIEGNGSSSFEFRKPVTITIDYSRCTRSNIDKEALTVWQIDPETRALLQNMGGEDDKASRTIRFRTDHLSTYSIAR